MIIESTSNGKVFLKKGYKIAVLDDLANRKHKCNFIIESVWYGVNGNHKIYSNLVNRDAIKLFEPKYKIINLKLKKKDKRKQYFNIFWRRKVYF